ncbi:MAG TPA: twin-arginine translocase subunit TatC [Vicinamibacterales bacterium]|nr:twin-arginine translocase subunit TatC [Vicinamibacterales bacterium]
MSFLEHLDDLRTRIIHSSIALVVGMVVAFWFVEPLAEFVLAPARRALPPGSDLIVTRPTETFAVAMDLALMGGLILAAPVLMYQLWLFVAPALYANEKKFMIPFIGLTSVGTLAGAMFSHYVLFPSMMRFFATFTFTGTTFMPRLEESFALYVRMLIGMIVVFQIPTLALFLAKMRLVTARFMWANIKYAILIILIAAAVLTPSQDPWNQILFGGPMLVLYLVGIGVAWLAQPKPHSDDGRLRLVFTAAVVDHAWRRSRKPSWRRL